MFKFNLLLLLLINSIIIGICLSNEIPISVTFYDQLDSNPDFENKNIENKIVQHMVNNELCFGKPTLNKTTLNNNSIKTINSEISFESWFNEKDGVSKLIPNQILHFKKIDDYNLIYQNDKFFPIDFLGFKQWYSDTDGELYNYHFCFHIHGKFIKMPNLKDISIGADDDTWLFINDKLEIDMGGVHDYQMQVYNVSKLSNYYVHSLDLFHCERHTSQSKLTLKIPKLFDQKNHQISVCNGVFQLGSVFGLLDILNNNILDNLFKQNINSLIKNELSSKKANCIDCLSDYLKNGNINSISNCLEKYKKKEKMVCFTVTINNSTESNSENSSSNIENLSSKPKIENSSTPSNFNNLSKQINSDNSSIDLNGENKNEKSNNQNSKSNNDNSKPKQSKPTFSTILSI